MPRRESTTPNPYIARVTVSMTPEQRKALDKEVRERKLADETLEARWGISDLIRELIEEHLRRRLQNAP